MYKRGKLSKMTKTTIKALICYKKEVLLKSIFVVKELIIVIMKVVA